MSRALVLGNGNILVCLDSQDRIRDFYYPHVGQENHVTGNTHRTGVWVDGRFSWVLESPGWNGKVDYGKGTAVGEVTATNDDLMIQLDTREAVDSDKNVFIKRIAVKNLADHSRTIKIFFGQHFRIDESGEDTVYYDPRINAVINFKGKRYFLINATAGGESFSEYATGHADGGGRGTYVDAEDGMLSKNPLAHGSVDSAIGLVLNVPALSKKVVHYWIAAGRKYGEVVDLNEYVLKKGPEALLSDTGKHWRSWAGNHKVALTGLDGNLKDLFKRSLMVIRMQADRNGGIVAAPDSRDQQYYSYVWTRDGAFIAGSLDRAGYCDLAGKFFEFCGNSITEKGYFLRKYRPDGAVGSLWNPWLKDGRVHLPIQEDETALVLNALWECYNRHWDDSFVKRNYRSLVKPAADFVAGFRDRDTNLPKPSYDLWEERLGVHTFTCCTVHAGLRAAERLAAKFGKRADASRYGRAAAEVREAILEHLYDPEEGAFVRSILYDGDGNMVKDTTADVSSGYGLFRFGVLGADDERVESTMNKIIGRLGRNDGVGGLPRYEGDNYFRQGQNAPSNPWFITTLWLAEYYTARARMREELKPTEEILKWVADRAQPTGLMAEQMNPHTGEPLSVSPLTWSHAAFVSAAMNYAEKRKGLA